MRSVYQPPPPPPFSKLLNTFAKKRIPMLFRDNIVAVCGTKKKELRGERIPVLRDLLIRN